MPPAKTKRVSAQHTRDRVRNNQRQHRARRRGYIATLEGKLEEAERTISSLKEHIKDLEGTNGALSAAEDMDPTAAGTSDSIIVGSPTDNVDIPVPVFSDLLGLHTSPPIASPTLNPAPIFTYSTPSYILIAHQNHKHLPESTIAAFLWPSFRASTSPDEGCRVATSTLYSLLAFISDVSSTYQELS
ncbi:hypothetical protein NW766_007191 [Fusarium irregulare]|uniref:BZIP domain-containing protein n=1 Tax=Fusarium irregulare TaxID=2494466 RepID=A0A9W8PMV7_9HYPO|nr:hypothetical protein NW766_007191 [Fusarium irregulare]